MNNKIIGFTISKKTINHSDVDVFNVGLNIKHKIIAGLNLYYWGIGDIDSCILDANTFTLSFPITESLLDRNVLIHTNENTITIENDWLGSIPIFFNKDEHIISTLCTKTVQNNSPKPDADGLNNYLDFGYSVFERTPVAGVEFLRFFSKIIITSDKISIEEKKDPALLELNKTKETSQEETLKKVSSYIHKSESTINGEIILPTSGGYDSRLLNNLIYNKKRIRSFTYGISKNQEESTEVIRAKKISEILNTSWKHIKIDDYNKYYKDWYKIFGWSTHLHGMYHIEFYKKITLHSKDYSTVLSGIIGDVWSGNVQMPIVKSIRDIKKLGYTHNINLNSKNSCFPYSNTTLYNYLSKNEQLLQYESGRIIAVIRNKIILLSYLLSIPDYLGLPSWTPFINMNIALSMLNLSKNNRIKRLWQANYFKKVGLDLESQEIIGDEKNVADICSLKKSIIPTIDPKPLKHVIKNKAVKINNRYYKILSFFSKHLFPILELMEKLLRIKYIGRILKNFGLNHSVIPYNKILILKPLEMTFTNEKQYE